MDSLALLCTLHADGPATLRRLRNSGCQSLVDLDRVGPDGIAELLSIPPAVARRLVREGRLLHERVGGDPLDAEEAPEGMAVATLGSTQAPLTEGSQLDDKDRALIRQVLGDARPVGGLRSVNLEQTTEPASEQATEQIGGAFASSEEALPETLEADPEPVMVPSPLLGRVDGLDAKVAAALTEAGIETLTALVEADASRLARTTGLAFGPLRRLQFLARKSLQVGGEISIPLPKAMDPISPEVPEIAAMDEGPVASFDLQSVSFTNTWTDEEEESEPISPMAPSAGVEDPFAKETWPEAKMPFVKDLEPESAGPMAEVAPKVQPLGRWMPRKIREAQAQFDAGNEPEPVLVPPPPPRRFWEPKRFWEARKNKRKDVGVEGQRQETENLQGGNLPPAAATERQPSEELESRPRVKMPSSKELGDLRWDFREPQFRPEANGKGGFQFEEPDSKEAQSDASGPFA